MTFHSLYDLQQTKVVLAYLQIDPQKSSTTKIYTTEVVAPKRSEILPELIL